MELLFTVAKTIGLPGSSAVNNCVRQGPVNYVASHWRRLESDCYFRLFSNNRKFIEAPANIWEKYFGGGHGLFGLILAALRYCYLAKLIAYFFIQYCFECDYDRSVAFGNPRITLW